LLLTTAVLALPSAAQAGSGDRFWSGIAPTFSHPPESQHETYHREYQPNLHHREHRERRERSRHEAPAEKVAVAKTADNKGRRYDADSKVWFDGDGHCWRGKEDFAFKDGAWFYGDSRWQQIDGQWRTRSGTGPASVDCRSVPVFAKLAPAEEPSATSGASAQNEQGRDTPYGKDDGAMAPMRGLGGEPPEGARADGGCRGGAPGADGTQPAACDQ
jgi:hypothetical protein